MSTKLSSANLSPRLKKNLMQAWHRGTKEMDLIFGNFVDENLTQFSENELVELEMLLQLNDIDLYNWISGVVETPSEINTPLFRQIIKSCKA